MAVRTFAGEGARATRGNLVRRRARLLRKERARSGAPLFQILTKTLVGQDYAVDYVDHAVGLEDVGDSHYGGATLFVFQDDVIAILQ